MIIFHSYGTIYQRLILAGRISGTQTLCRFIFCSHHKRLSLGSHYVGWVFSGGGPREWEGLLLLRSKVNFSSGSWSSPKASLACLENSGACLWSHWKPSSPTSKASLILFHTSASTEVALLPNSCMSCKPSAARCAQMKKRRKSLAEITSAQRPADLLIPKAACFSSIDSSSISDSSKAAWTMRWAGARCGRATEGSVKFRRLRAAGSLQA